MSFRRRRRPRGPGLRISSSTYLYRTMLCMCSTEADTTDFLPCLLPVIIIVMLLCIVAQENELPRDARTIGRSFGNEYLNACSTGLTTIIIIITCERRCTRMCTMHVEIMGFLYLTYNAVRNSNNMVMNRHFMYYLLVYTRV